MNLKNVINMIILTATTPTTSSPGIGKTGVAFIDEKTGTILGILMGVVSIIGIFLTVKNIAELSTAIGDRDATTMKKAGLELVGSIMMAGVGIILSILGFTV